MLRESSTDRRGVAHLSANVQLVAPTCARVTSAEASPTAVPLRKAKGLAHATVGPAERFRSISSTNAAIVHHLAVHASPAEPATQAAPAPVTSRGNHAGVAIEGGGWLLRGILNGSPKRCR